MSKIFSIRRETTEMRTRFHQTEVAHLLYEKLPPHVSLPGSPLMAVEVDGEYFVLVQRHERSEAI